MKTKTQNLGLATVTFLVLALAGVHSAVAQSTAFTYQGRLTDNGGAANGSYDLKFRLYSTDSGGSIVAGPITNSPVGVTNGLFTVSLDFGAGVFTGPDRWLEIGARTNGGGAFTTLSPRQKLTPSPYAIFATTAATATNVATGVAVKSLNGLTDAVTLSPGANVTFTPSGNGIQISSSGGVTSGWALGGNSGTTAANFLGTSDNQPLELKVNGARALRLEPNTSGAPNVIGGSSRNIINAGVVGGTIAGGGATIFLGSSYTNRVASNFATVGGGAQNTSSADNATTGGGYNNTSKGVGATIAGGMSNTAESSDTTVGGGEINHALGSSSTVGGGFNNTASGGSAVIAGGANNLAQSDAATVGGGTGNIIATNASGSTISGGSGNTTESNAAFVGGGSLNHANGSSSTLAGGFDNTVTGGVAFIGGGARNRANSSFTTIAGGENNTANGAHATIGGGYLNRVNIGALLDGIGTISGGRQNSVDNNDYGTIGGGRGNLVGNAMGNFTAIAGTVPGGYFNEASGDYSFAAGRQAKAIHPGSFVWANWGVDVYSIADYRFHVYASGGLEFQNSSGRFVTFATIPGQAISSWTGGYLSDAGIWQNASDRNRKTDFAEINGKDVLHRLIALPVQTWRYTNEVQTVKHLGPTAQDFAAAFGLGSDDKAIGTLDESGVALAAIQGLHAIAQEKDAQLKDHQEQIADLKTRLTVLEKMLTELAGKK